MPDEKKGTLKVTLVRSPIGRHKSQKLTVQALGIHKLHQTVVKDDTPAIRGMINKVSHLVEVEE